MSSQSNSPKFSNSIFQRLSLGLALVLSLTIIALVLLCMLEIRNVHKELRHGINEISQEVIQLFRAEGRQAVLEEYDLLEQPRFDYDEMLSRFDHGDIVFAFRSARGVLITGATELEFTEGWHKKEYLFEEETIKVIGKGTAFPNGATMMIQMPLGREPAEIKQKLKRTVLILLIFSLFLLISFKWLVAKYIDSAVSGLTKQIDDVAKNPENQRLSINSQSQELHQLASSLNKMLDEVSTAHRNMQTMSVGIAHDLKTPLARVAYRLQLMQQDIDNKTILSEHIDKAYDELTGIVATFSNMIRLNEIESGRRKSSFVNLNVSQIIHDIAESYQPVFEDQMKQLDISIVDNVRCLGDADLLNQLVSNLLENALVYSEDSAKVWLRLQSNASGALLQIGDSGPGIPNHLHEQVFDRFYRADYSRGKPGNGLGLSIVKAICELHGATITLIPNQEGAVFDITIPTQST